MNQIDFSAFMNWYIDNEMKNLPAECLQVVAIIGRYSYGHFSETRPVHIDMILEHTGSSLRTIRRAIVLLEDKEIIKVYRTSGGHGKKSEYGINVDYLKLCQNCTSSTSRNCDKNTAVNFAGIHGSDLPLLLGESSPPNTDEPPAASPTAAPPVKSVKQKKPSRTDEEKETFAELWAMFEKAIGCKITGKESSLEAKSIWELIDRVAPGGNGWRKEITDIVVRFFSLRKNPPKGFDYLKNCPPLPHILNSSRTWIRINTKQVEEKVTTLADVHEYTAGLRARGVIK